MPKRLIVLFILTLIFSSYAWAQTSETAEVNETSPAPTEVSPETPVEPAHTSTATLTPTPAATPAPQTVEEVPAPAPTPKRKAISLKEVQVSGEAVLMTESYQSPSSVAGQTAFISPVGILNFDTDVNDWIKLHLDFRMDSTRDSDTKNNDIYLGEFYASLKQVPFDDSEIRYGQIPSRYIAFQRELADIDNLSENGSSFFERFNYIPARDLGFEYSILLGERFLLSVSAVNGEGNKSGETGKQKDVQGFINWNMFSRVFLSLFYQQGHYENIDPTQNSRNRASAQIGYHDPQTFTLAASYLESLDAVDGAQSSLADGVDLSSRGGQLAKGRGYEVLGRIDLGKKLEVFGVYDNYDPDNQLDNNSLSATTGGVKWFWSDVVTLSVAGIGKTYQTDHSISIKDAQKVNLALKLLF